MVEWLDDQQDWLSGEDDGGGCWRGLNRTV